MKRQHLGKPTTVPLPVQCLREGLQSRSTELAAEEEHEIAMLLEELERQRQSNTLLIQEMDLERLEMTNALEMERTEKKRLQSRLEGVMKELENVKAEKSKMHTKEVKMQQQKQQVEEDTSDNDFSSGSYSVSSKEEEDSQTPCVDGCRCPSCLEIWEKRHYPHFATRNSPRRLSYYKFKDDLRRCSSIKFDLSREDVLELEEVKSIQTDQCEYDKLRAAGMRLSELKLRQVAIDLKAYCEFLVDNDMNLKVHEKSRFQMAKEHQPLYPNLLIMDLDDGIIRYWTCISDLAEGTVLSNILSKDLKMKAKELLEKFYVIDLKEVDELRDPLDFKLLD